MTEAAPGRHTPVLLHRTDGGGNGGCHRDAGHIRQAMHLIGPAADSGGSVDVVIFTVTELIINARECSTARSIAAGVFVLRRRTTPPGTMWPALLPRCRCHGRVRYRLLPQGLSRGPRQRFASHTQCPRPGRLYNVTRTAAPRILHDRYGVIDYYNRVFGGRCVSGAALYVVNCT